MKRRALAIGVVASLVGNLLTARDSFAQDAPNISLPSLVVIVRHADRAASPPDDPPLNEDGKHRTEELGRILRDIKFAAVVTSQAKRTKETAAPIAAAIAVSPDVVILNSKEPPDVYLDAIKASISKHPGQPVLIVTHSLRIGSIIGALGGPKLPIVCESVYDHLFLLIPRPTDTQLVALRYGAVSPTPEPGCM